MSGNAYEWCLDWYGFHDETPAIDPAGPEDGVGRVIRGGSWTHEARDCRVADRAYARPEARNDFTGFRIVFDTD
jgi:formylglycine-generating enzyme required for sulfatase activity